MEMIFIEFLVGLLGGTGSGLFVIRHQRNTPLPVKAGRNHQGPTSTPKPLSRQALRARNVRQRRPNRGQNRSSTRSSNATLEPLSQVSVPQATVISCPACGLQAPENLITEHFLGSPSHQNKPIEPPATIADSNPVSISTDDDPRDSVRSLLQMLVPPRAFGRRHGQRNTAPLTNLIRTMNASRNAPVG